MPAEAGLRLAVPGRIDALDACRRAVLDFLAPHGLGPQAIYNVELVLEEALVNAITHGWPDANGEHGIELSVEVQAARVVLVFEDDGVEFDPRRSGAQTASVSIDSAPIGGRGLLLVGKAAGSIAYQRAGGRNRLTICVARG
jgi:anti-sigma regulatory factor (Ser/Thr protein kinase)